LSPGGEGEGLSLMKGNSRKGNLGGGERKDIARSHRLNLGDRKRGASGGGTGGIGAVGGGVTGERRKGGENERKKRKIRRGVI